VLFSIFFFAKMTSVLRTALCQEASKLAGLSHNKETPCIRLSRIVERTDKSVKFPHMICPTASGWVFSDAVTNKNTASDDRMINEELARIWKETALH
jgi:hypothetical protein